MSGREVTASGIVVVDKPPGWTSHDVVGRVRRRAGTRKVGHAGTLDPMATGVLVLGLNRATRLLGHLTSTEKDYTATVRLGESTDTDDADGSVTAAVSAEHVGRVDIEAARDGFLGYVEQVPSTVSAVKVDGRRAHARARAGEEVRLRPRTVHVSRLDIADVRPAGGCVDVDVDVRCSSGTYVRAIARDLGAVLGVGGHLTALRRTRAGGFTIEDAVGLDDLAADLRLLGLGDAARTMFPVRTLDAGRSERVRDGRPLPGLDLGTVSPVALFDPDGTFLALYRQRGAEARAVAVFVS